MGESACIVTVHGIGFQQPPEDGNPGYADALHEHLRAVLGDRLGDDPERPGGGPVYVSSEWKGSPAQGLARLRPGRPLVRTERTIAHVALVYSPSEPIEPRLEATADTLARAAIAHSHYVSALGALRLVLSDAWAALHEDSRGSGLSTLTPRTDLAAEHHQGVVGRLLRRGAAPAASPSPDSTPGALSVLRALEDDVATYVTRNDLRERVRGFVQSALLALVDRTDIAEVVVNAHSQGTVLCWDVLGRLPFSSWASDADPRGARFAHFVTAGSPIRKYVDMFAWGDQVGELGAALAPAGKLIWHNFCDPHDPVADPLNPPASWRPGQPWTPPEQADEGLLVALDDDTGDVTHAFIEDVEVDNIEHSSGGGLQAHDYWNNTRDFVPRLAALV